MSEHIKERAILIGLPDLLITAAAFLVVRYGIGSYFELSVIGPISVVAGVLVATWRLHERGASWGSLGLRRPSRFWTIPLWVVGLYGTTLLAGVMIEKLAPIFHSPPVDLSRFANLQGNLPAFLMILAISWTTAAFGEEMLFRGFLRAGLQRQFGGGKMASVVAALSQAVLFGLAHNYQGPKGVVIAGAIGLVYGIGYLLNGRNLWALIVAHGLTDSLSMLLLFLGLRHVS